MKKSVAISVISVLAILVIVFGAMYFSNNANKTEEISRLQADVDNKSGEIAGLQTNVESMTAEIAGLKEDVAGKAEQISTLQADVESKAGEISALKTDVAAKEKEVETLKADVAAKTEEIKTLNTNATKNAEEIKTLKSTITAKEEAIKKLEADVTAKEGEIKTLTADVTEKGEKIKTLEADVSSKEGTIKELESSVAAKDGEIKDLKAEVDTKAEQIKSLESTVASKDTEISELNAKVKEKDEEIKRLNGLLANRGTSEEQAPIEINLVDSGDGYAITQEYIYDSGWGYSYYALVLKNTSGEQKAYDGQFVFYNAQNEIVGVGNASIEVLDNDYETAMICMQNGSFDHVSYSITPRESKYYNDVHSFVDVTASVSGNKAILIGQNNGTTNAQYVEYHCFFLDDAGKTVGYDEGYLIDSDSEIKPGKMEMREAQSSEPFASVVVYFTGQYSK